MLNSVTQGTVKLSSNYEFANLWKNYNDFSDTPNTTFKDLSFWYRRSAETKLTDLSQDSYDQVFQGWSLYPNFGKILLDDLEPNGAVVSAYVSYESTGVKVTYPGKFDEFYADYPNKSETCPEIFLDPPHNITDYDPRCRDFYKYAKVNEPNRTFYGPYTSAGNDTSKFFAATVSKPVFINDNLESIVSIDVNLNYNDSFFDLIWIDSNYSYSYVTSTNGRPLFHSKFEIKNVETVTFTKLEFTPVNETTIIETEPTSDEALEFNRTLYDEIIKVTSKQQFSYYRFGRKMTATATPISLKTFWDQSGQINAVAVVVTDELKYFGAINYRGGILFVLIVIMAIFCSIFFVFLLLIWYLFYKIASYSLRPIKVLNSKIKDLMQNDAEFNLSGSQKNITSFEVKELYLACSELLVARRFSKNNINKNDALAIMDFADAYSVLNKNEQAKGICLTNIANIHFRNRKYSKAAKSYKDAANWAKILFDKAKADSNLGDKRDYIYLYCKRKYYQTVWRFYSTKERQNTVSDDEWQETEKEIGKTIKLIIKNMTDSEDLVISLHLYSSYCCMMTKRLISADNELKEAKTIFKNKKEIDSSKRHDIPVLPSWILIQKILLMSGLLDKCYGKDMKACLKFTKLLKVGKYYDPKTRMEALTYLDMILSEPKYSKINSKPEIKNIKLMLELFREDKYKDVVLLVDSHNDTESANQDKINNMLEVFDNITAEDRLALITMSRKVNVIYSLSQKSKNTIQLRNQLSSMIWEDTSRCHYLKGISMGINELVSSTKNDTDRYMICITSSKDLKSFAKYTKDEKVKLKEAIEYNKVTVIFIIVADQDNDYIDLKQRIKLLCPDSIFMRNPKSKEVMEIIKSISNVTVADEELVFERFE